MAMVLFLWFYLLCPRGFQSEHFNITSTIDADSMCCDCLTVSSEPGCSANSDCEHAICSYDSFCCDEEWDSLCVSDASGEYCNETMSTNTPWAEFSTTRVPGTVCCDCLTVSTSGGCNGNSDCEDIVCALDSFCCYYAWDEICAYNVSMQFCNDTDYEKIGTLDPTPFPTFESNASHTVIQPDSANATWGESIECHTAHCIILCLYHYGCATASINITNALSVDIQCLEDSACFLMNAVITNTSTVSVYCEAVDSCRRMELKVNGAAEVDITCSGPGSCGQSNMNIQSDEAIIVGDDYGALGGADFDGQHIKSRFTVKCKGSWACFLTEVKCPAVTDHGICDLSCLVEESCTPLYALTDTAETLMTNFGNTTNNVIERCPDSDDPDCVGLYATSESIECAEGEHCQLHCNSTSSCKYHILDASHALSLRLHCTNVESCAFSTILCPSSYSGASCAIACEGSYSCDRASVVVSSHQSQCDEFRMECTADGACAEADVRIGATNVDNVFVVCSSYRACLGTQWSAIEGEQVGNVFVNCNGYKSCFDAGFAFHHATNLDVQYRNETVCQIDIFCPYQTDNSCNIDAECSSDQSLIVISVPEDYHYGYLNITESGSAITVYCSQNHKSTMTANIAFNNITQKFECTEDGASFCCPWGSRVLYDSNVDPDLHREVLNPTDFTESDFDYDFVDFNRYIPESLNQTHYVVTNGSLTHSNHTMICNEENCVFQCIDTLSCAHSTLYINGTDPFDVLVSCSSSFSCFEMALVADSPSPDLMVTIICSGTDSCRELTVNLTEFDSFNLYCVETESCQEVVVNLDLDLSNDNRTDYGMIHCVLPSVCDDLKFNTNSERSQLVMYEFSRGIVLNNGIGYLSAIDNIECNQNRWIQFDGDLESDYTVSQSVYDEYDGGLLPCLAITVQCGDNRSCAMTYNYIGSDMVQTLNDGSDTAYSVHFDDLFLITCNGECVGSPTESPTNVPSAAPSIATTPLLDEMAAEIPLDPVIEDNEFVDFLLMGFALIISVVAVPSLLYQNGNIPMMTQRVDTSRWTSWIGLGLQFWNFSSNIWLCNEMWSVTGMFEPLENRLILLSAIGSTAYIIISYISNLGAMARFKRNVRGNEGATTWFGKYSVVFAIMVMVTGGYYPSLILVTSHVFGFEVFSSGLTQHEISGLLKLQIYHSVFLQNIPHLIFQGLYASTFSQHQLSSSLLFASTSTVLSLIAAISSHLIHHDHGESARKMYILQYFLVTESNHDLSEEDRHRILLNRGWRRKLSRSLTAFWKIPDDSIEIGNTSLSPKGAITHIVQSMDEETVKDYVSKLFEDRSESNVTLRQIAWQFYWNQRKEISVIFQSHFGLNEDFNTVFRKHSSSEKEAKSIEIPVVKKTIESKSDDELESKGTEGSDQVTM